MRTLDEWVRLLASESSRAQAEEALADALISDDVALRTSAARHLMDALPGAAEDVRGLMLFLLQSGWTPSSEADAVHAVSTLIDVLARAEAGQLEEADDAALILGSAARVAKSQREVLLQALERPESLVRRAAAGALGRAGALTRPIAERLARCLTDDEPEVADAAVQSLAAVGPELVEVVLPALAAYASICEGEEQYGALAAMRGVLESRNPKAPLPALPVDELVASLERALAHPEPGLRLEAAGVAGLLGQSAMARVLTARLEEPDPDVLAGVAVALLRLGEAEKAIAAVGALLKDADPARHGAALHALESLEPATFARHRSALAAAAKGAAAEVAEALNGLSPARPPRG